MPVILCDGDQEKWLRRDSEPDDLRRLVAPLPAYEMKSFPVSSEVNGPTINEPHLVEPVEPIQEMTTGSALISVGCHGVSTESGSDRVSLSKIRIANDCYPVATALGTDSITKLGHYLTTGMLF